MKKKHAQAGGLQMRTVLLLLILSLIAALVVSIVFFSGRLKRIEEEDEALYMETLYQVSTTLINADRDLYQAMLAATEFTMYTGSKYDQNSLSGMLADYKSNSQQAIDNVNRASQIAQANPALFTGTPAPSGLTYEELAGRFNASFKNWQGAYDMENHSGSFSTFIACFESTRAYLSDMTDITEAWADAQVQKKSAELNRTILVTGVTFAIIAVVLFVLSILVSGMISKSIRTVSDSITVLSGGDFVTPVNVKTFIRDFNEIALSLNDMRERLRDALIRVIGHADNVNVRAENTKARISDSQRTTNDITNAVGELAQGATMMAQDVQSTTEITVNIGSSVDQVLEAANSNLEKGRTVYENSTQVSDQLEELRRTDEETDRMAGEVAESVNQTSEVVQSITKAARAIISIASQTNMLALNASIEAARAGEAGKGFVVVANNIKDLAADSNHAAEQITSMLSTITELSDKNKDLTASIKEATGNETAALQEMVSAFSRMQSLLLETEEGNRQIVSLVESLTTDKNSIMSSVESLSSVSEENAASTQETSASLTQLDSNMESVVEQAESLQQIASELEENVRFFKVRE
ncbi:MAG: methyl-accepting chemotaxis protein [Lachnospiraceae bacterium]|nr:methyl-accepting chemotaxis protein [Lachnospiraceae bacterium]